MKKIIVGTPRSGTSFVTKWYANENPKHIALDEQRLYEHFEPDYQGPMDQQRYEAYPEQMHEDFQEKYPSGKSVVLFVEICYALM